MRQWAGWVACLTLAATAAVSGQDAPPTRVGMRLESATPSARAAVDSFFAAVEKERWAEAARWIDIERFAAYFKQTVSETRARLPEPRMTAETLMAQDTTMPRAVAEWQLARMRSAIDSEPFGYLSQEFARVHTQAELFALTPMEGAARWLEAQDPRAALREAWRLSGCKKPIPAELLALGRRVVVAMAVVDTLAYVVTRARHTVGYDSLVVAEPMIFEPPSVITMRRVSVGWRIEPQHGLLSGEGGFGFGSSGGDRGDC